MNKSVIWAGVVAAAVIGGAGLFMVSGGSESDAVVTASVGGPLVEVQLPETLSGNAELGKLAFDSFCVNCHGANGAGRDGFGPPLIHKIYEPSHHGDIAFLYAARNGVQAHHWRFGNMPPVEGISDGEVAAIVAYIRALQRANGIN